MAGRPPNTIMIPLGWNDKLMVDGVPAGHSFFQRVRQQNAAQCGEKRKTNATSECKTSR